MAYLRLVCGTLLLLALSTTVQAVPLHIVNGAFDPDEWTVSATDGTPARPTVTVQSFNVGGSNGAFLFVEQTNDGTPVTLGKGLGNELKLGYDFVNSRRGDPSNTAFDVFFAVGPEDYDVHISIFGLQVFQKSAGTVSPVNPDGSLKLSSPPWTPLGPTDSDFILGGFVGAVGFGTSPNSSTFHLIAEFELSVSNGVSDGLYSPDPAFWSASTSPGGFQEPCFPPNRPECPPTGPISSAIFTLNKDGTTKVDPVLGPNGGPILQPVPQPTTLVLFSTALMGLWFCRRRQGKA